MEMLPAFAVLLGACSVLIIGIAYADAWKTHKQRSSSMSKKGDRVLVTDQHPPMPGTVLRVSTWSKVNRTAVDSGTCYDIDGDGWQGSRWIGALFGERLT